MLDRILYRLAVGSWSRFRFLPGPGLSTGAGLPLGIYVHIPFCRSLCSFCPDVRAYCEAVLGGRSPAALHARLNPVEAALYRLFWRCYEGRIDLTDSAWAEVRPLGPWLAAARRLGLVAADGPVLSLTRQGFFLFHLLERYYTRRYIARLWQAGREEAFPGELEL
ncbi:MAG TPA: hypothetical protein DEQ28_04450 [Clostridiales bacterium]|nr:hypothetical protein [Clostridiales bacterium]